MTTRTLLLRTGIWPWWWLWHGVAFLNDNREAAPAYTENVAPETKLREALETCQEAQQALVAVAAAPVLAICPGGLSPGGDAVGLLATGCWWGVRLRRRCLRLWPDADLGRRWWR